MYRPALYHQYNELQKCIAEKAIDRYSQKMQWHHNGMDSLIDIGTATGNVLMDLMKAELPETFTRIVGCDISNDAIAFAKELYRSEQKCEFRVLDITEELPVDLKGQFDHVTSFSCLHWVRDQVQALKNIYDLLKPDGGDCLLTFPTYVPIFDIYDTLRDVPTWQPYIGHVDFFAGPLMRIEKDQLVQLMHSIGFEDVRVEIDFEVHHYKSAQKFKDHMAAGCMFMKWIPPSMHETFMMDVLEVARRLGCRASSPCGTKCSYSLNFTNAMVYVRKLPNRR